MANEQDDLIGFTTDELSESQAPKRGMSVERKYKAGVQRQQPDIIGYELEDFVSENNAVRAVDAFVDSLDLRALGFTHTQAESNSGQPAYSPSMLLKLYLYGYQNRIRSTRNLARECRRNIEVMWLVGRLTPQYRTIGAFRANNAGAIRRAHKQFIQLCRHLGLLSSTRVSVDGSHFKGDASSKSFRTKKGLNNRNEEIEKEIDKWNNLIEQADAEDSREEFVWEEMQDCLKKLAAEKETNEWLLQVMEDAGYKYISRTDIDAQRMSKHGKSNRGYNVQIAVDAKSHLIVADDVTNNANDREELFAMAQLSKEALEVEKLEVLADQGYSSGKQFKQCYVNGITPLVPVMKSRALSNAGNRYETSQFSFDKERNVYVCPMGELLKQSGPVSENGSRRYRSRKRTCDQCEKRSQCVTENAGIRYIRRSEHEELMEYQRKHMEKHPDAMRERASMVEHPFGTLKMRAGWTHFLLRGKEKVRAEWSLMALGYNMTRVLSIIGLDLFIECCQKQQMGAR